MPPYRKHKKPKEETKAYQRKQAGILKQKLRKERTLQKTAFARQASKLAINELAQEAFGEQGLTPARLEALSSVVVGPEGGQLSLTSPQALRCYINKARKKFFEHADRYVEIHLHSTAAALSAGEFDVAARHAEWAMTNLGDEEERIVAPAQKAAPTSQAPIMVGVNLGGLKQDKS